MLATNISFRIVTDQELKNTEFQNTVIKFLFTNLGQYTDPEADIRACLEYVREPQRGGSVFIAEDEKKNLKGAVLLAKTNMHRFVPDYLLVYIAIDKDERGKGIGKNLLELVKSTVKAPVALHVEHENPAKKLYERVGFTSKYAEMRWYP